MTTDIEKAKQILAKLHEDKLAQQHRLQFAAKVKAKLDKYNKQNILTL